MTKLLQPGSLVYRFLAVDRWTKLLNALRREAGTLAEPELNTLAVIVAILVCLPPVALTYVHKLAGNTGLDLSTVAFGVCTLLAIVLRRRFRLDHVPVESWRESMSLTHTAFALGCLPAIVVLIGSPELLTTRNELLNTHFTTDIFAGQSRAYIIARVTLMLLAAASWVAVTEEFLFRGLLVSVVRRWNVIKNQKSRDILAGALSALLFGIAHYPTWGFLGAAALSGLGVGFVMGYLASGERLTPVILYHFFFDTLSITAGILLKT